MVDGEDFEIALPTDDEIEAMLEEAAQLHARFPIYRELEISSDALREVFLAANRTNDYFLRIARKDDGEILGVLLGHVYAPPLLVNTVFAEDIFLYVRLPERRRGVGRALVGTFEHWARNRGATRFILNNRTGNKDVPDSLFSKLGYHTVGRAHMKEIAHG